MEQMMANAAAIYLAQPENRVQFEKVVAEMVRNAGIDHIQVYGKSDTDNGGYRYTLDADEIGVMLVGSVAGMMGLEGFS